MMSKKNLLILIGAIISVIIYIIINIFLFLIKPNLKMESKMTEQEILQLIKQHKDEIKDLRDELKEVRKTEKEKLGVQGEYFISEFFEIERIDISKEDYYVWNRFETYDDAKELADFMKLFFKFYKILKYMDIHDHDIYHDDLRRRLFTYYFPEQVDLDEAVALMGDDMEDFQLLEKLD